MGGEGGQIVLIFSCNCYGVDGRVNGNVSGTGVSWY